MRLVDASQLPAYMMLVIQEWLNLVLDVVVMFMAVLLTTVAVRVRWSFGDISQGVPALTRNRLQSQQLPWVQAKFKFIKGCNALSEQKCSIQWCGSG
jgi:hypothetical protein